MTSIEAIHEVLLANPETARYIGHSLLQMGYNLNAAHASGVGDFISSSATDVGGLLGRIGLLPIIAGVAAFTTFARYISPFAVVGPETAGIYLHGGSAFYIDDPDKNKKRFYGIVPSGFYLKVPGWQKIVPVPLRIKTHPIPAESAAPLIVDRKIDGKKTQVEIGALATRWVPFNPYNEKGKKTVQYKGQSAWNVYNVAFGGATDQESLTQAVVYGHCQQAFLEVMQDIPEDNFRDNDLINLLVKRKIGKRVLDEYGVELALLVNKRNETGVQVLRDTFRQEAAPAKPNETIIYGYDNRVLSTVIAQSMLPENGYHAHMPGAGAFEGLQQLNGNIS